MQGTYRLKLGWLIFIGAGSLLLLYLYFVGVFMIYESRELYNLTDFIVFFIFSLPLLALGTAGVIELFYAKIVIEKDRIYSKGILNNHSFTFDKITGVKRTIHYVHIFSGQEHIDISKYVKDVDKIYNWSSNKFKKIR
ncbi:hypothetical protein [Bernardetia sp.]|uniref:hypothetical protein n=1 Tax=Bernardetia sp. TaxID=1937974 RepID=UPI0025C2A3F5|nr:hypothetical protein [Bernardetia sp.]